MSLETPTSLVVFAKAPVPGHAKTRLIPVLGAAGAAALAERLLDRAIDAGVAAGFGHAKTRLIPVLGAAGAAALAERLLEHAIEAGVAAGFGHLELCTTPDASHPAFQRLASRHRLTLSVQGDGDLGARMNRALNRTLQRGEPVLLIGADAPALDAATLLEAEWALQSHDAVFVPALDGGYVLVGLRRPAPGLFEGVAWSTSQVMALTRERAGTAGLRWAELPAVPDVDVPADLGHLPSGWWP